MRVKLEKMIKEEFPYTNRHVVGILNAAHQTVMMNTAKMMNSFPLNLQIYNSRFHETYCIWKHLKGALP